ncbi:PREDICTED: facilitated trehalose transporter Tret1-like [Papilio polytes]|uniref:facilitated trehalose transporter Tret1-like n=1 Tax=Papilio polytes TaxID=76194 RepID=UPI000675EA5B|nr:PREDICTED: facilitated trehalose transporter Tret1-like [Papilio polytes]
MKNKFVFNEGNQINQIICAIFINIPAISYGTTIGWMSPMTLLLQSKDTPTEVPLTDIEISWIASLPYLVCVPANYLVAYVGDRFGRKLSIIFMSTMCAACWILKLSSYNIWAFLVARCLAGIVMAASCVNCPVYTKEVCDNNIRGALGCMLALFFTTGSLFTYIIGDLFSYRTVLWICLSIPVFHLITFTLMPESPSYLVKIGKEEEAAKALSWLRRRGKNHYTIQNEIEALKKEQKNDIDGDKFLLKAILKDKILFKAFQIALMAALAREVCGAVPVLNFAGGIFAMASEGTGLILSPNQQAMMLGVVQLTGSLLASSVVEKVGRKVLMAGTCLISGLSMFGLASWFLARDYSYFAPAWIPVFTLCLCILCDASGLQPISVVITGEIFSFKYRGSVLATTMAIASLADFLQLLYFKPLASSIGVHYAFYFFSFMCLSSALYTIIVVPETKARDLEDIYDDLRGIKRNEKNKEISTISNSV